MLRALIIDDEPLARSIVKEYLQKIPDIELVGECNDGFEGVKAIMQYQPDLIFLDIQMPKINGFEMLELIEQKPAVIFTTAFDEYAMKAFETHAVDYLLKPFSFERFLRSIDKLSETSIVSTEDSSQFIDIIVDRNALVTVNLIDMAGRTVLSGKHKVYPGINNLNLANAQAIQSGVYTLQVINADNVIRKRVVKRY